MPTIDLTTAPPPPRHALDGAPRRVGLTLRELQRAAELAGGAPLPFDVAPPSEADAMESRLGASPATTEDQVYRQAVAALPDPTDSLTRRGLVVDGDLDAGLAGAVGLLATPATAVDLDVAAAGVQGKAWHRSAAGAVAALATVDGIVFELAWFGADRWPDELARVAAVPEEVALRESAVPSYVDLPYELADAAAEAMRSGRADLLPVVVARHPGGVAGPSGALSDAETAAVLTALSAEAHGRLRGLVADVSGTALSVVGVASWTLVADGWRALRPHRVDGEQRVEIRAVGPADLAGSLAPALAEVVR